MNTFKKRRMQAPLSLLFATALLLAFAACGDGQSDGANDPSTQVADTTATAGLHKLNFPGPAVNEKELACAEAEFATMVHSGNTVTHASLKHTTIKFNVGDYQSIVSGFVGIGCQKDPGLAIHFGYEPNGDTLSMGFSFVCMDLTNDIGPYVIPQTPLYTLDQNHKFDSATYADLGTWQAGPGKEFQDKIVVDKYDDGKFQFLYKGMNSHMLYKLAQIDSLIAHNKLDAQDWIEVVPIAEPQKWSQTDRGALFAMSTCLVARDATKRLITNDAGSHGTGGNFDDRGSDLGSLCPPMCDNVAVFTATGIDVRAICK